MDTRPQSLFPSLPLGTDANQARHALNHLLQIPLAPRARDETSPETAFPRATHLIFSRDIRKCVIDPTGFAMLLAKLLFVSCDRRTTSPPSITSRLNKSARKQPCTCACAHASGAVNLLINKFYRRILARSRGPQSTARRPVWTRFCVCL